MERYEKVNGTKGSMEEETTGVAISKVEKNDEKEDEETRREEEK